MSSLNSLRTDQDDVGRAMILGVPRYALGGDRVEVNDNVYGITDQIRKVLSSTGYDSKIMKKHSEFLTLINSLKKVGCTGIRDRNSKHKIFL